MVLLGWATIVVSATTLVVNIVSNSEEHRVPVHSGSDVALDFLEEGAHLGVPTQERD